MVDSLLEDKTGKTPSSRLGSRLARTIVLGSIAVAVALYWLARSYGVELEELLGYLKTSLLFVGFFALFGILAGLTLYLIRSFRRR